MGQFNPTQPPVPALRAITSNLGSRIPLKPQPHALSAPLAPLSASGCCCISSEKLCVPGEPYGSFRPLLLVASGLPTVPLTNWSARAYTLLKSHRSACTARKWTLFTMSSHLYSRPSATVFFRSSFAKDDVSTRIRRCARRRLMVRRDFNGERVVSTSTRCLLGGVEGEVKNSSMRRSAMEYPRPLHGVSND